MSVKCVCDRTCFLTIGDTTRLYTEGDIAVFKECPPHFISIELIPEAEVEPEVEVEVESNPIDFKTATEEELAEGNFEEEDLRSFIKSEYGKNPGKRRMKKLTEMLLKFRD